MENRQLHLYLPGRASGSLHHGYGNLSEASGDGLHCHRSGENRSHCAGISAGCPVRGHCAPLYGEQKPCVSDLCDSRDLSDDRSKWRALECQCRVLCDPVFCRLLSVYPRLPCSGMDKRAGRYGDCPVPDLAVADGFKCGLSGKPEPGMAEFL